MRLWIYHLKMIYIFESAEYRADLTAVATAVTAVTATKAPPLLR